MVNMGGENKETRQSVRDAVVQWMRATYFKLTLLADVHFPPHKPYIVAAFTHNMKTEQLTLTLYTKKEKRKKTGLQKGYHKGLLGTCKNM